MPGESEDEDVFGHSEDMGVAAYVVEAQPGAAVEALTAPAPAKRAAAGQDESSSKKVCLGMSSAVSGVPAPAAPFVPASLERVEERLSLAGEQPRFVSSEPGCLRHTCTSVRAEVTFWPGTLRWRVTGVQAETVEDWLLRPEQSLRPAREEDEAAGTVSLEESTSKGLKRKAGEEHEQCSTQPLPMPLPMPMPCDLRGSSCGTAEQAEAAAAPSWRPSEPSGGGEPAVRRRRLRGKQAPVRGLVLPPLALCTRVPPHEDAPDASTKDGALQSSLALRGGGGVRVPRTHLEVAVSGGVTGTGSEGGVPANTQPSDGPGAPELPAPR